MCGLCGFVGSGNVEDLKRMNDAIVHRGPDEEGVWMDETKGVYFGHRRLSIIDLSGGKQPMWTSDKKLGIIFNGEIYNYPELRKELSAKGHQFLTDHSDTEVLLHGYREWGSELPNKLNGMWAFTIYDVDANKLFISRDRFGKKPLFYSLQNGTFAFSSELSSLIKHSKIENNLSVRSLKKYFAYGFIPAPNSVLENVFKLPGGYNLVLDIKSLQYTVHKYWDFKIEPFAVIPSNPEKVWSEQIIDLLDKAVKRRLMSDVPLGVFLSGGVDSSAITYFASKHIEKNKFKAFSIGFEESSYDESAYSKRVASFLNVDHQLEILSIEMAQSLLPDIIAKLDEPMGDSSIIPTYLLCREARKQVTVALGGDGADELFAGYDPFRALSMAKMYETFIPKPVHKAIVMMAGGIPTRHTNMSFDFRLKRMLRGLSYDFKFRVPIWIGTLDPKDIGELFHEPVDMEDVYSEAVEMWDACESDNLVDKTLQFYTKLYLQDDILVKIDRASMMNSLEVRAPFLDIDLVNFVRQIPHQYKYRGGQTKYILKKALEAALPHDILYRSKKGFGIPVEQLLTKVEPLDLSSIPAFEKIFNSNTIKKQSDDHRKGKANNKSFLWNLWVLQQWNNKLKK